MASRKQEEAAQSEEQDATEQAFAAPSQDMIEEWKSKNPAGIFGWESELGLFVWRMPPQSVWAKFTDASANTDSSRSDTLKQLVVDCMLHPSATELRALAKVQPALMNTLAGRITEKVTIKQKKAPTRL